MVGWKDRWMFYGMDRRMVGGKDGWMEGRIDGWMEEWMKNRWIAEGMEGLMDGEMCR